MHLSSTYNLFCCAYQILAQVIEQWAESLGRGGLFPAGARYFILPYGVRPCLVPITVLLSGYHVRLTVSETHGGRRRPLTPTEASARKIELYIHSPACLHSTLLNKLRTGTALHFAYEIHLQPNNNSVVRLS